MALSDNEIHLLINKLRDNYLEYSKKFSRSWFNVESFESRLNMAYEKRMNLEAFILAEVANFEKLKKKYESKKNSKSFGALVDSIMEENVERIKKYEPVYFHPQADVEMVHFYGALSDFSLSYYSILWSIVDSNELKNKLNDIDMRLNDFSVPMGRKHSRRVLDHIAVLNRAPYAQKELDIEKDKSIFLKESAFILHEISDLCESLLSMKSSEWELPLKFDKLFLSEEKSKKLVSTFSGFTGYGAIMKVKERAETILSDFRLEAFRRR